MPFASLIDQQGVLKPPKAAPTNQNPGPITTPVPEGVNSPTGMIDPATYAAGPTQPGWSPGGPNDNKLPGYGPPPSPYLTDPGYQAALGAEQLGVSQLDSALKAAQERAIIDFGDPALAGMAGFGLDPQAAAFARQNYLSGNAQLARLDKSKDLARQAVVNRLAAHGILSSGDLGYGLQEADSNYGNALYDARQKVLDYLNGLVQQTLGSKRDLRSQVVDALQNAYANYVQNPQFYPSAPAAATVAALTPKITPPPLRNPYVTGQKRYG